MKRKKIIVIKASWISTFLIAVIATFITVAGCSTDKTDITNPNPSSEFWIFWIPHKEDLIDRC